MNKINTAILSYGMSGHLFHAPFIDLHPEYELYAVWERSKNLAEQKYPGIKTFRSLEELLTDKQIELVIVNTPNYSHFEYTKKALEAGKHVVVEKPFVVSVEEGEELISIAKEKKLILSVYQNRRYDSDFRTVKRIIQDGQLGEIVEAEFHFDRYNIELSPKAHKETAGPGTGALYDLGSHIIDQALQLFGLPTSVFADIRTVRPKSVVADYFEILLYYKNLRVRLHSSYFVCEPLPAYIIHGSTGSFIKAKTDIQEISLQAGISPSSTDWGKEQDSERGLLHTFLDSQHRKQTVDSERGNYMDYYNELYSTIRHNSKNPVTAEDGLNVIRIITSSIASSEKRKVMEMSNRG